MKQERARSRGGEETSDHNGDLMPAKEYKGRIGQEGPQATANSEEGLVGLMKSYTAEVVH